MRNKKNLTVLFKKRVLFRKKQIDFYGNCMAPSYFLNKNSFMFNKFFRKFFSSHFHFLKKLRIFTKIFATNQIFYRSFVLEEKKYIFGNCAKFNKNYKISEYDEFFYFLKNKKIKNISCFFFSKNSNYFKSHSNFFYVSSQNLLNLPDSYENLENFFYKGEIYANWLNPIYNDNLNTFLESFNFDYLFEYHFLFVIEVYKIHTYTVFKNSLIILYFY